MTDFGKEICTAVFSLSVHKDCFYFFIYFCFNFLFLLAMVNNLITNRLIKKLHFSIPNRVCQRNFARNKELKHTLTSKGGPYRAKYGPRASIKLAPKT